MSEYDHIMPAVKHTPEQVTKALTVLAEHNGNVTEACDDLRDNHEIEIRSKQLREYRASHSQQYSDIERAHADALEGEMVNSFRSTAAEADKIEKNLLARAETVGDKDLPAMIRAVADVKSKNIDKMLALQGRSPTGEGKEGDLSNLLNAMVEKNLVTINVNIDPPAIEATAKEVSND